LSDELTLPIRLDQFLKLSNLVGSGGEAKILIQDGLVRVNGEVEQRRGRKLQAGDKVSLDDSDPVTVGDD
jgi:ribosome-associated protein